MPLQAKILNFSIAYGKTAFGLSKDWGVTLPEAEEIVRKWCVLLPLACALSSICFCSSRPRYDSQACTHVCMHAGRHACILCAQCVRYNFITKNCVFGSPGKKNIY